jgi:hypothetical protein
MMISDRRKGEVRRMETERRERGDLRRRRRGGTVTEGQSGGQRMDGWKHRAKIIS